MEEQLLREVIPVFDGEKYTLSLYKWDLDTIKRAMNEFEKNNKDKSGHEHRSTFYISNYVQIGPDGVMFPTR